MSHNEHANEGADNSERSSSNWRPAGNNRGYYRKDRRQGQRRWSREGDYSEKRSDRRADRRSGWHDDRRNDRGNRNWDNDRRDDRRNDRGKRRWDNDRQDNRDDRRWDNDRRDNRRWDNDRRDDRRGGWRDDRRNDRGKRRWDNDRQDNRGGRRWDNDRRDNRRWDNDRRDNRRPDNRQRDNRRWDNDQQRDRDYRSNERSWNRKEDVTTDLNKTDDVRLEIPESITSDKLDASARKHLRSLNKENAEQVARHLAYAGEMLDIDPEVAYQHARAAYQRAARIDVVREALGIAAYLTERYAEALRELRTYRRMSNDYSHVALEADAERGLGRPKKALQFIDGIPLSRLNPEAKVELALVTSGARAETGDSAGGLAVLEKIKVENLDKILAARVQLIKADRLDELGREEEATALREKWEPIYSDVGDFNMVVDLDDVLDDLPAADLSTADETEDLSTDATAAPAAEPAVSENEDAEDNEEVGGDVDGDTAASSTDLDDIEIDNSAEDFDENPEPTGAEN